MEKNKIVTSLTLAGILTAGVLGGNSNAASNSLGVCKNIVPGESLVPYILGSASDIVTSDRIRAEYTTASNLQLKYSNRVSTGDTFTTSTGKKTVIVYGDANQDGKVDTYDAYLAQDMFLNRGEGKTATAVQRAAADVLRNNNSVSVDTYDASNIQQFYLKGGDYVNVKPVGEKDETVEEGYTLIVGDGNIVNNQGNTGAVLRLTNTLAQPKSGLTLRVYGENRVPVGTSVAIGTIEDHKDEVVIKNQAGANIAVALGATDGIYTVELVENEGRNNEKILARTTVTKNTVTPSAAKVSTVRTGWDRATLSFVNSEENGANKNAKIYYTVIANDGNTHAPASANVPTSFTKNSDGEWVFDKGTTYVEDTVDGNFNKELKEPLNDKVEYTVYYVLENTFGSRTNTTTAIEKVIVKSGTETGTPEVVDLTKVKTPDLKKGETSYEWPAKTGESYKVVVYKDGKIIKESTATITSGTASYPIATDFTGAGKYKIEIAVDGASNKTDSEYVMTPEVEVVALNKVTDVDFNVTESGNTLSWKDSNDENDVLNYGISVYLYNDTTKAYNTTAAYTATGVVETNVTKDSDGTLKMNLPFNGTDLLKNKAYRAEIVVNPKVAITGAAAGVERKDITASEATEINDFFVLDISGCSINTANGDITSNSAKITVAPSLLNTTTIKGLKLTNFRAQAYKAQKPNTQGYTTSEAYNPLLPLYVLDNNVTSNFEDGKIIVGNLQPETNYVFKIFASVSGKEGESEYLVDTANSNAPYTTLKVSPEIKNRVVTTVKAEAVKDSNKVYVDSSELYMDGVSIGLTNTSYAKDFRDSVAVIDVLNDGDIVTIDGDSVTIELGSASTANPINFGTTVKDKVVNINGKGYECTITIANANKAKELNLTGSGSKYHLDGAYADKITLSDNIVVEDLALSNAANVNTAKVYTVLPGDVTINGIKVNTGIATELKTGIISYVKTLYVAVNNQVQNNLVFENLTDSRFDPNAEITFVGDGQHSGELLGTIVIKTNNGKVSVVSDDTHVKSNLTVDVQQGSVDIKDSALTGNKTITVNHKDDGKADSDADKHATTIDFKLADAKKIIDTNGAQVTVNVQSYKLDDTVKTVTADPADSVEVSFVSGKSMEDVVRFLNEFNLDDSAKATLTIEADGQTAKLTIKGDVTDYSIPAGLVK